MALQINQQWFQIHLQLEELRPLRNVADKFARLISAESAVYANHFPR